MVRFEQFRHAFGQIVGEDDLQTPLPRKGFKNPKGWTGRCTGRGPRAITSCSARRARAPEIYELAKLLEEHTADAGRL